MRPACVKMHPSQAESGLFSFPFCSLCARNNSTRDSDVPRRGDDPGFHLSRNFHTKSPWKFIDKDAPFVSRGSWQLNKHIFRRALRIGCLFRRKIFQMIGAVVAREIINDHCCVRRKEQGVCPSTKFCLCNRLSNPLSWAQENLWRDICWKFPWSCLRCDQGLCENI